MGRVPPAGSPLPSPPGAQPAGIILKVSTGTSGSFRAWTNRLWRSLVHQGSPTPCYIAGTGAHWRGCLLTVLARPPLGPPLGFNWERLTGSSPSWWRPSAPPRERPLQKSVVGSLAVGPKAPPKGPSLLCMKNPSSSRTSGFLSLLWSKFTIISNDCGLSDASSCFSDWTAALLNQNDDVPALALRVFFTSPLWR